MLQHAAVTVSWQTYHHVSTKVIRSIRRDYYSPLYKKGTALNRPDISLFFQYIRDV